MTMSHSQPDEKPDQEPRGRSRVPVDYPAFFSGDEGAGRGMVVNLTLAGGEIETNLPFSIGARVCLQVHPPDARPPIVITLAIVRWRRGDRLGLEFVRFEGDAKAQLKDMLNQGEDPA